jgi:hypothetical protein
MIALIKKIKQIVACFFGKHSAVLILGKERIFICRCCGKNLDKEIAGE